MKKVGNPCPNTTIQVNHFCWFMFTNYYAVLHTNAKWKPSTDDKLMRKRLKKRGKQSYCRSSEVTRCLGYLETFVIPISFASYKSDKSEWFQRHRIQQQIRLPSKSTASKLFLIYVVTKTRSRYRFTLSKNGVSQFKTPFYQHYHRKCSADFLLQWLPGILKSTGRQPFANCVPT